jgi:hypothetical protein
VAFFQAESTRLTVMCTAAENLAAEAAGKPNEAQKTPDRFVATGD